MSSIASRALDPDESDDFAVDSVDSGDAPSRNPHDSAGMRGTLVLGPPPVERVDSVDSSTSAPPESLRLLALVGTDDDPYRGDGEWAYANEVGGRCFDIMQYEVHASTGQVLITEQRIRLAVSRKGVTRYAWVRHDLDTVSAQEAQRDPALVLGAPKRAHFHIAEDRKSFATIAQVARSYGVAPERVAVKPPSAFLDLLEYMTHEHPRQQSEGKHLYPDDAVQSNFDWRAELDDHKLARSLNAGKRASTRKAEQIFVAVSRGDLTLAQVREMEPELYASKGTLSHLQKLRGDFLAHQDAPDHVVNFYIYGPGGVGKDLLAKALARALNPEASIPFFKLGGENVSWEGYDGELVVIWEDMRVGDMLRTAKSRGMLFRILGPWRERTEAPIVNVKNSKTQLLNRVNIVTGPESYDRFLRGLAGEYESMQGGIRVKHEAENLAQGFRRFPVIIPVAEQEFSIFVNLGVLHGTREYQSYEKHERMRQSLELLNRRCRAITDAAEAEATRLRVESATVAPILAQYNRIIRTSDSPATPAQVLAEFASAGQEIPQIDAARTAPGAPSGDAKGRIAQLEAEIAALEAASPTGGTSDHGVLRSVLDRAEAGRRLTRGRSPAVEVHPPSSPRPWESDLEDNAS